MKKLILVALLLISSIAVSRVILKGEGINLVCPKRPAIFLRGSTLRITGLKDCRTLNTGKNPPGIIPKIPPRNTKTYGLIQLKILQIPYPTTSGIITINAKQKVSIDTGCNRKSGLNITAKYNQSCKFNHLRIVSFTDQQVTIKFE